MIGRYIINMVMCAKPLTFEENKKFDVDGGFVQCFEDYDNKWERHPFQLQSDDALIKGEYIVNPASGEGRKKVAVVCHGLTATRAADCKYAKIFYDCGYNLVIFDERYFGESSGPYCTLGGKEAEDVKKIIAYAKEVFGADAFIALHGESMGAATALKLLDTEKPAFVVADCPFSDLGMLIDDLAWKRAWILGPGATKTARRIGLKRYNYDYRAVVPINSVRETEVPICFMHGMEDSLINCKHSKRMFEVCRNPLSEIHLFKGADHALSYMKHQDEYPVIMKKFIEKIEKAAL